MSHSDIDVAQIEILKLVGKNSFPHSDDLVILVCGAFLKVVFIKLEVHVRISLNHEVLVLHISGHTSKYFPQNACLFYCFSWRFITFVYYLYVSRDSLKFLHFFYCFLVKATPGNNALGSALADAP